MLMLEKLKSVQLQSLPPLVPPPLLLLSLDQQNLFRGTDLGQMNLDLSQIWIIGI